MKYNLDKVINKREYIKSPIKKGKKIMCKDCKYFKFDYYCDYYNCSAKYPDKKKVCNRFIKATYN